MAPNAVKRDCFLRDKRTPALSNMSQGHSPRRRWIHAVVHARRGGQRAALARVVLGGTLAHVVVRWNRGSLVLDGHAT